MQQSPHLRISTARTLIGSGDVDSMTDQSATTSSDVSPPTLIPKLPDDVALQCIARIPRSHYASASLVSKSWRSTIQSPLLFTTRTLLNCTQHFLLLNLRINSSFSWFRLDQDPRTLSPLPPIPSPLIGSAFAVSGPKIYVIGGSINEFPCNTVWVFDCRFNKWEIGPKMRVGREFAAAGTVNGRIYVIGGCLVDNWTRSRNWAEVFDPATGLWAPVPSPIEVRDKWMHASAVVHDKIYALADRGGVVYDPVAAEWSVVSTELDMGWRGRAVAVDGVLYCYDYLGKIRGYVVEDDEWKELKGVHEKLPKFLCGATMANLGGRLCVVWEGKGTGKEVEIMCAEIEVRRDECRGLSGSIVWCDLILVVPKGSSIVHCLAVAL